MCEKRDKDWIILQHILRSLGNISDTSSINNLHSHKVWFGLNVEENAHFLELTPLSLQSFLRDVCLRSKSHAVANGLLTT